jgi:hypothetical protein
MDTKMKYSMNSRIIFIILIALATAQTLLCQVKINERHLCSLESSGKVEHLRILPPDGVSVLLREKKWEVITSPWFDR